MRARTVVFGVIAALVVGAGGHLLFSTTAGKTGRQAMTRIQKSLPDNATLSYSGLGTNGYTRTGGVREVFYDSPKLSITATLVRVRDFARDGDGFKAAVLGFENVEIRRKDLGVRYQFKRAAVHDSNLINLIYALPRSSPQDVAQTLRIGEVFVGDLASGGKGAKLTLDGFLAKDVKDGTAARVELKGLKLGDAQPLFCAIDGAAVPRLAELALATLTAGQEAALLTEIMAICK